MRNQKMYEADDKMISLIRDNYDLLQMLGSFGISLGFGDKTVKETCVDNGVDTYTFLAVVNFTINGYGDFEADEAGKLPPDLKRGVLSEDGVYDILSDHYALTVRLLDTVSSILKNR